MSSQVILQNEYFEASFFTEHLSIVATAKKPFIPEGEFKSLFMSIAEFLKEHHAKKLIFDKRNLRTFHQPSMEWYHVHWKPLVAALGLTKHRKILPEDNLFRKSVEIGREKIKKDHPNFDFDALDIVYVESVEEGFAK